MSQVDLLEGIYEYSMPDLLVMQLESSTYEDYLGYILRVGSAEDLVHVQFSTLLVLKQLASNLQKFIEEEENGN